MRTCAIALTLALVVALAPSAAAQTEDGGGSEFSFGGVLTFASEVDFGVGARAYLTTDDLVAGSRVAATFNFFFPEFIDYWELCVDGHYFLDAVGNESIAVYVGGGLFLANASVDIPEFSAGGISVGGGSESTTDIGVSLLGGADFALENASIVPFAEARLELGGFDEQFLISGGVRF